MSVHYMMMMVNGFHNVLVLKSDMDVHLCMPSSKKRGHITLHMWVCLFVRPYVSDQ